MGARIKYEKKESIRDALRHGLSIDDAAAFYGVSRKAVLEMMKGAASEQREELREEQKESDDA